MKKIKKEAKNLLGERPAEWALDTCQDLKISHGAN
jgi:hypothetical protein